MGGCQRGTSPTFKPRCAKPAQGRSSGSRRLARRSKRTRGTGEGAASFTCSTATKLDDWRGAVRDGGTETMRRALTSSLQRTAGLRFSRFVARWPAAAEFCFSCIRPCARLSSCSIWTRRCSRRDGEGGRVDESALPISEALKKRLGDYYAYFAELYCQEDHPPVSDMDRRLLDSTGLEIWQQLRRELAGQYQSVVL